MLRFVAIQLEEDISCHEVTPSRLGSLCYWAASPRLPWLILRIESSSLAPWSTIWSLLFQNSPLEFIWFKIFPLRENNTLGREAIGQNDTALRIRRVYDPVLRLPSHAAIKMTTFLSSSSVFKSNRASHMLDITFNIQNYANGFNTSYSVPIKIKLFVRRA